MSNLGQTSLNMTKPAHSDLRTLYVLVLKIWYVVVRHVTIRKLWRHARFFKNMIRRNASRDYTEVANGRVCTEVVWRRHICCIIRCVRTHTKNVWRVPYVMRPVIIRRLWRCVTQHLRLLRPTTTPLFIIPPPSLLSLPQQTLWPTLPLTTETVQAARNTCSGRFFSNAP
jgi:hypothetical protein